MKQFIFGNVRVQVLCNDLVRIERGNHGRFSDANTFFIPNKISFRDREVSAEARGNTVAIGEYTLAVPEGAESLTGVTLAKKGKTVYEYAPLKNSGELPALDVTPDAFALADTPRIVLPEGGYSYRGNVPDSGYFIEENAEDVYLFLCGGDFKKLRRLYVELTGRSELVRLSTLGSWNSKYFVYDENSAMQLILDYEKRGVPLDNMVIDTDWRAASDRGIGYDVDLKLFPDMARFLRFAHGHGVEITFNDHPEPVEGAKNLLAPEEVKYREEKLTSILDMGLDIWWYDRNWHTKLKSPTENINPETFGLYLFEDITRHHWQKQAGSREVYRRPVIMGNVDNVLNGAYKSIESSASHRFSIQWTGDIGSENYAIAQEVESLIRGGNSGIAYINADCGGHTGNPDKTTFIRWMQFGVFSPVFRPHCTNTVKRSREPWTYDEETFEIVKQYNLMRYRLLPVIYKNAYENYLTGEPIFKSLGYEYPNDERALKCTDEYMLGNNILVAPVAGTMPEILEKERFVAPVEATYFDGRAWKGAPLATAKYDRLNLFCDNVAPEKGVPVYDFSARFTAKIKLDESAELILCTDDGATAWVDGKKVLQDEATHGTVNHSLGTYFAGEHELRVDYFQAGGEAECTLRYAKAQTEKGEEKEVYLPEGKWLDVFDGKVYEGGRAIQRTYALREMPLFVRSGALLPIAREAKNTKEQQWNELVYDFYPCKEATDCGYLYEDDTETTAYKKGEYRKSAFGAEYCKECNAYIVKLDASQGKFAGEKCFASRKIALKYHLSCGENVTRVTVNGKEAGFEILKRNQDAYPFSTGASPDCDCVLVKCDCDCSGTYEIKFYL